MLTIAHRLNTIMDSDKVREGQAATQASVRAT
jgi:ABC-type transport system involved in Fe-S cluster assembly fused permease/ATPase subunit